MQAHVDPVLRIRTPLVIHETVDGEVVIVNLESGTYYSLVGTGAVVWSSLEKAATAAEITARMRAAFTSGGDRVEESVRLFLAELQREGLIAAMERGDPSSSTSQSTGDVAAPITTPAAFTPPLLEKFTDMQELILLDPVHEVEEEKGWPHPKPAK